MPAAAERTGLERGASVAAEVLETALPAAVLSKEAANPQPGRDVTLSQTADSPAVTLFFSGEGNPPEVVKAMNRLRQSEDKKVGADKAPGVPADVKLLSEIRDILASRRGA